jgi:hypothetical protein
MARPEIPEIRQREFAFGSRDEDRPLIERRSPESAFLAVWAKVTPSHMDSHHALERLAGRVWSARSTRPKEVRVEMNRGFHERTRPQQATRGRVEEYLAEAERARTADQPEVKELREAIVLAGDDFDTGRVDVPQELDHMPEEVGAVGVPHVLLRRARVDHDAP